MKYPIRLTLYRSMLLFSVLSISPVLLLGQDRESVKPKPVPVAYDEFSLEFDGGTASELIDALRELNVNVISSEAANEIPVPPFQVYKVAAMELFTALNHILDAPDRVPQASFLLGPTRRPSSGVWTLVLKNGMMDPRGIRSIESAILKKEVEALVNEALERRRLPGLETRAEPVYIGELLEELTVDDVTTAIIQVVKVAARADNVFNEDRDLSVAYHPETKLLVLAGPEVSMDLATKTKRR